MKVDTDSEKIKEVLTRRVQDVVKKSELEEMLKSGKKIRLYNGVDPSGAKLHLGHGIVLNKLKEFQDLGHEVILLIGDFTGMIGDPTDRDAVRKPLTRKDVLKNAEDYKKQASRILNFSGKNPVKVKYNSKWLDKISFRDLIPLASNFTVQQLLERDMFQERVKKDKPIHLHEFLYPLMQGYDSVAMDVDLEVGGNDQLFNMLAGRTLMQKMKNKTKVVLTCPLIEGLDGRKMSKTYNNTIDLDEDSNEMFGKVMSMKDELITKYFELTTDVDAAEIRQMIDDMKYDNVNPRDLKVRLARELVTMYHSEEAAMAAESEFNQVFKNKGMPSDMPTTKAPTDKVKIVDFLIENKLVPSKSEARRLIQQNAVKLNNVKVSNIKAEEKLKPGDVVQVGKRKFLEIK